MGNPQGADALPGTGTRGAGATDMAARFIEKRLENEKSITRRHINFSCLQIVDRENFKP